MGVALNPRGSDLEVEFAWGLRVLRLPTPEREYRFHASRRWRFDFAWPDRKLAVEVEGGTWVSGGHNRGAHFESDCDKYNEAALAGWQVLRVTNHMVHDGRAVDYVRRAFDA